MSDSTPRDIFEEGSDFWRRVRADRAAWLIDAANYFTALESALRQARHQVLLLAWDIDSRLVLDRDGDREAGGSTLSEFLGDRLRDRPELEIFVLGWDYSAVYAGEREWLTDWRFAAEAGPRLRFRLDNQHAAGASHHQKVVVIDDRLAFSGGLDLTGARWDTRDHKPDEPRRQNAEGRHFGPFHDVQAVVDGDAARALGDLARERWLHCTGESLPAAAPDGETEPLWPDNVPSPFRDIDVLIARTRGPDFELPALREVEHSYLTMIAAARRYLYLENQYFTSGRIAAALSDRLTEPEGPEIVMVVPREGSGWLERKTMGALRDRYLRQLRQADRHGRLTVLYPHRDGLGDDCIHVHSKLMAADDQWLRIGSANLSARSMGLDTECDLIFDAANDSHREAVRDAVLDLVAEHAGVSPDELARCWQETGTLGAACRRFDDGPRCLKPLPEADRDSDDAILPRLAFDAHEPIDKLLLESDRAGEKAEPKQPRRKLIGFLLLLAALVLIALAWRFTPLGDWLRPERIAEIPAMVRDAGPPALIVPAAFAVGSLIVVPVTLLIVGSALIFGAWWGSLYSLIGILVSGALTYGIGAFFGRDIARSMAGSRINRISRLLGQQGILTLAALRLLPVAPYTIVNIVAGASHIRIRDFLIGSVLGMAPGVLAIGFLASGAGTVLAEGRLDGLLMIGAAAGIMIAITIAARSWRRRMLDED